MDLVGDCRGTGKRITEHQIYPKMNVIAHFFSFKHRSVLDSWSAK
jgi:hypothetical protein